ncbi:chondroitin sulfate synthase 1 [Patella vulgata]|uniref:chondroitin sulfate synthase 1 n=1 Tax=Patella vulgata TaxID=6465 RepID=UPI00217F7C4A|nr:chondroitin sulfate synthase 1 [Patella vulgata]XP_050417048.1 chondroitin sulfate synthase 1 [Patella vulgata]
MGRRLKKKICKDYLCVAILGLISGFLVSNALIFLKSRNHSLCLPRLSSSTTKHKPLTEKLLINTLDPDLKLLLICVITTRHHLDTRALAIQKTWANSVIGDVIFFTGGDSNYTGPLPVVVLNDVSDDEYPPRHKSFAMLQYVSHNYGNRYHWFMRVDDDIFVYGKRLSLFLMTINSKKMIYMGHPGNGSQKELGHLGLYSNAPYCMGGTGIVLSRIMLNSIASRLPGCLNSTVSNHEDTELGRCIYKYHQTPCTRATQFDYLFHQNYDESSGKWTDSITSTKHLTRHPIKNVSYIYKNDVTEKSNTLRQLENKVQTLSRDILQMSNLINNRIFKNKDDNLLKLLNQDIPWSVNINQSYYSLIDKNLKEPAVRRGRHLTILKSRKALTQYVQQNKNRYHRLRLASTGYFRVVPNQGLQHIIFTKDSSDVINPFFSLQTFEGLRFSESNIIRNATKTPPGHHIKIK